MNFSTVHIPTSYIVYDEDRDLYWAGRNCCDCEVYSNGWVRYKVYARVYNTYAAACAARSSIKTLSSLVVRSL